jgi:hypothetical protein
MGYLSLYWSNVIILVVYDLVFLYLLHRLISLLFSTIFYRSLCWILLSMSPVMLTFASNSAFNMQGYIIILLGLCGTEYFFKNRQLWGAVLIAAGFFFISQGYPLSFFLPYYIAVWVLWRLLNGVERPGSEMETNRGLTCWEALHCWFIVTLSALIVQFLSGGIYFKKISPLNPHDNGNVLGSSHLASRLVLFLKQSFWPEIKVDNIPFGFAPYFVYVFIFCLISLYMTEASGRSQIKRFLTEKTGHWYQALALMASGGLIAFGYLPAFMNPVVKSQRAVFGDIFLILVVVLISKSMEFRDYFHQKKIVLFMTFLIATSDTYYLSTLFSVNHSHNHSPVFDFDLSDGVVRHDLITAIKAMKKQVEEEKATLVIYYPRGYSENTTDPGMFFAHFLRHFGPFKSDSRLIFPYKWSDMRYGCPFPEVAGKDGSQTRCYVSPDTDIQKALTNGKRVMIWEWKDSQINLPPIAVPNMKLQPVNWSNTNQPQGQNMVWECHELVPT